MIPGQQPAHVTAPHNCTSPCAAPQRLGRFCRTSVETAQSGKLLFAQGVSVHPIRLPETEQ